MYCEGVEGGAQMKKYLRSLNMLSHFGSPASKKMVAHTAGDMRG